MGRRLESSRAREHEITFRLDRMAYGGDAIGRADGKAIFVRGGIAGEWVRAEVYEDRGRFARARVIDVREPSPDRVSPRCPHFGFEANACGGCHWQHIDYAAQLRFKTEIVREQLQRIGRIGAAVVRDIIPSPGVWAYRNQARFSVTPDGRPGFQAAHSNHVVPIEVCYIVQPPILEWLETHKHLIASDDSVAVRASNFRPPTSNFQSPTSNFQVNDTSFRVSAESFFQVNSSLIETLIDQVLGKLDLRDDKTVLDAYCGVGLFSRFMAPKVGRVIGIESNPSAVMDARDNLDQFERVELYEGLVEQVLPTLDVSPDAAVVDPPRAGCGPLVVRALIERSVQRLVYVSCDPSTFARDARQLIDGGYRLVEVQPLDMFPQTYHIEVVALFEWISPDP